MSEFSTLRRKNVILRATIFDNATSCYYVFHFKSLILVAFQIPDQFYYPVWTTKITKKFQSFNIATKPKK